MTGIWDRWFGRGVSRGGDIESEPGSARIATGMDTERLIAVLGHEGREVLLRRGAMAAVEFEIARLRQVIAELRRSM